MRVRDDNAASQNDTAIAGGIQRRPARSNGSPSPRPSRAGWTGTPVSRKVGRLDGWIVLGNGKYTDNLTVWALCVPNTSIRCRR